MWGAMIISYDYELCFIGLVILWITVTVQQPVGVSVDLLYIVRTRVVV